MTTFTHSNTTTQVAIRKQAFLCVAPVNSQPETLTLDQMTVVSPVSCSIQRIALEARKHGHTDQTHTIYQVYGKKIMYTYSIDKN